MYTNDEKQFRRLTSLVLEQSEYFKADFTVHWKSDYVNYCKWIQCVGTNTKSSAAYWKKKGNRGLYIRMKIDFGKPNINEIYWHNG